MARVGEAYQAQIAESRLVHGDRRWVNPYFRQLEEEGLIRCSRKEGRIKYYRLTQKGFNTLLDSHSKEAVMGLARETLEPIKSKVKENTFVVNIHFDFLIENELGIRVVESFKIPKDIPRDIRKDSDYVNKFLTSIRDGKLEGKLILSELKTTLQRLNNILLIYTGHEPSELKKSYAKVLNNIYYEDELPDSYKYTGVIEDTIKMIKRSPKNVRFVFARTEGLEKVKEVIEELLPT